MVKKKKEGGIFEYFSRSVNIIAKKKSFIAFKYSYPLSIGKKLKNVRAIVSKRFQVFFFLFFFTRLNQSRPLRDVHRRHARVAYSAFVFPNYTRE